MTDKKFQVQDFVGIEPGNLLATVRDLKGEGYRLIQICGTMKEKDTELLYSFDKDHISKNLRMLVPEGEQVESLSGEFWSAFIYENEVHDLFGITFKHLALDFGGKFFKVSEPTPWNPNK